MTLRIRDFTLTPTDERTDVGTGIVDIIIEDEVETDDEEVGTEDEEVGADDEEVEADDET